MILENVSFWALYWKTAPLVFSKFLHKSTKVTRYNFWKYLKLVIRLSVKDRVLGPFYRKLVIDSLFFSMTVEGLRAHHLSMILYIGKIWIQGWRIVKYQKSYFLWFFWKLVVEWFWFLWLMIEEISWSFKYDLISGKNVNQGISGISIED